MLVTVISIENGYAIGQDLTLVETYFDLGARAMTLTHGGHNDIGDSATPRDYDEEEEDDDSETEELKREIAFLQEQNVVSQPILQGTTVTSRRVQLLRTGPPAPHDGQVSLFLVAEQGWLPLPPEWKPEHLIQLVCA